MNNYTNQEIEIVRFKLVESTINTKILVKECKGINTFDDIEGLKNLYFS